MTHSGDGCDKMAGHDSGEDGDGNGESPWW